MEFHSKKIGRLEVITGSMYSGKSEELIRRLRRAKFAKQKVVVFKINLMLILFQRKMRWKKL